MNTRKLLAMTALIFMFCVSVSAQTTEFTYQGQLQFSSAPADGIFDLEFALFDRAGAQIGPTLTKSGSLSRTASFRSASISGRCFQAVTDFSRSGSDRQAAVR